MPDLHAWITGQVDKVERIAEAARGQGEGRWRHETGYHSGRVEDERGETVVYDEGAPLEEEAAHIAFHDPAAVLRRCAADRKILARHRLNPDAYWSGRAMCEGCGTTGDCDWPVADNLNDCPELLDLAEGYGLTTEILASLDRPERGPRPEPTGPGLIPDGIAEAIYGNLLRAVQATDTGWLSRAHVRVVDVTPPGPAPRWFASPGERAFGVVEPHLSAVALYKPDTNPEA